MSSAGSMNVDGTPTRSAYRLWMEGEGAAPPYAGFLGITLLSSGDGESRFEWTPTAALFNFTGRVSGGFVATCLDFFSFVAALSVLEPDAVATTAWMDTSFFRPISDGVYQGEGRVVNRSRRTIWADGLVRDAAGDVCARGTQLVLPLVDGGPRAAPRACGHAPKGGAVDA